MSYTDTTISHSSAKPEETVFKLLELRRLTLCVAESCTGGLFAKRLTDIPGVSTVFPGGVVVYNDLAKSKLLGISPKLIQEKHAVSREVALAMADGARNIFDADIGVGITGIAGPGSDISGQTPGTVFIAFSTIEQSQCHSLAFSGNRNDVRESSATYAFKIIERFIMSS